MTERLLLMLSILAGWAAGTLITYALYRAGALDWLVGERDKALGAALILTWLYVLAHIAARPLSTRKGRS